MAGDQYSICLIRTKSGNFEYCKSELAKIPLKLISDNLQILRLEWATRSALDERCATLLATEAGQDY